MNSTALLMRSVRRAYSARATLEQFDRNYIDQPYDLPDLLVPLDDTDDWSDLDDSESDSEQDDEQWEVFVPDDDESDPQPDPYDFWGSDEAHDWDDV